MIQYKVCPGCNRNRTSDKYCESCTAAGKGKNRANMKTLDRRGTAHERGYDKDWRRVRLEVKQESNWLCQCHRCRDMGRVMAVTKRDPVHHVLTVREHPHLRLHKPNLCSMRYKCHEVEHGRAVDDEYETYRRTGRLKN